jgi:hypothetical protein
MPRILPKIEALLEVALSDHEDVDWEASFAHFPDPSGELVSMVCLFIEIKGAALGTVLRSTALLNPNGQTQDTINEAVRQTLDRLEEARSQQLTSMAEQGEEALKNGRQSPKSGLILPG